MRESYSNEVCGCHIVQNGKLSKAGEKASHSKIKTFYIQYMPRRNKGKHEMPHYEEHTWSPFRTTNSQVNRRLWLTAQTSYITVISRIRAIK